MKKENKAMNVTLTPELLSLIDKHNTLGMSKAGFIKMALIYYLNKLEGNVTHEDILVENFGKQIKGKE